MDISSGTYVNSTMTQYGLDGYNVTGSSINCMGELLNILQITYVGYKNY